MDPLGSRQREGGLHSKPVLAGLSGGQKCQDGGLCEVGATKGFPVVGRQVGEEE